MRDTKLRFVALLLADFTGSGAQVARLPVDAPAVSAGLQTLAPHTRVTRARYPNGDPELCTDCWHGGEMKLWHKDLSCVGTARVVYKNLVNCDERMLLPDGTPCKNDSAMWDSYNTYSNGHGGCCAPWSGDSSPYGPMGNYFCGTTENLCGATAVHAACKPAVAIYTCARTRAPAMA